MAKALLLLLEEDWESSLSNDEMEAELIQRGFSNEERAIFWLVKEKVRLENKYDLETGELD